MAKLYKVIERVSGKEEFLFWCPACKEPHRINAEKWTFNGDLESPTFNPSYLVYDNPDEAGLKDIPSYRCHSYITNGNINFLEDCSHKLRGVHELPDINEKLKLKDQK